jgi:hypothetical protein
VVPLKNRTLRSPTEHLQDDVTAILRRLFSYSPSFRPLLEASSTSFLRLTGQLCLCLDVYAFNVLEETSHGFLVPLNTAVNSRIRRAARQQNELLPAAPSEEKPTYRGGSLFEPGDRS